MAQEKDFPENVQEIFRLMRNGPLLKRISTKSRGIVESINAAIEMQQNQDIKKPYYYILDVTESASGEIDSPPFDEKRHKFRELTDSFNYYEALRRYFATHEIAVEMNEEQLTDLAEAIYEDLSLCAQARLMMKKSHPYFENLLTVYKSQGFPCAWEGGRTWKKGNFVVFFNEGQIET